MPSYHERFQKQADVQSYEETEYGEHSYSSYIWNLQKAALRRTIEEHRARHGRIRLLDFACGTGRILSFVEGLVSDSDGLDLSPAMIARAEKRCPRSQLMVGDIVEDPSLAAHRYDIITAFRFLLNAEEPVRRAALRALRQRIDEDHGILIANVHGNSFSLRHLALAYRRWTLARESSSTPPDTMLAEMSKGEMVRLLRAGGFEVAKIIGFGVTPQFLYRTAFAPLARAIDRGLAARSLAGGFSIDLMLICTPRK